MFVAGATVPGDKVSKKKKEVVKTSFTQPKTAILELPSSDTDSQNGKSEMEGNYMHHRDSLKTIQTECLLKFMRI